MLMTGLLMASTFGLACDGGGPSIDVGGPREVVVTIGHLTDLTGPSASGMEPVNTSLKDTVKYFSEANLIPGVKVEVIEYDGRFDPANDIPGYEWLRQKGADLIYTGIPGTALSLKTRVNQDRVPLFAATIDLDELDPGGYVFCTGIIPQLDACTLLNWLAENDWDYQRDGPARIGGAGWEDAWTPTYLSAAERYCNAHPDQFEWIGGLVANFTFNWDTEVQALRDADYVMPPNVLPSFVKQYRAAGGAAKFVAGDPAAAFMGLVRDADLCNEMDGALFVRSSRWWNEDGKLIDLTKEILRRYHPRDADEIIRAGAGYLGVSNAYMVLEAIRLAARKVGVHDLGPEPIYEAAQSVSVVTDGVERYSFDEEKRASVNYYGMYELSAEAKDLIRVSPEWVPAARCP